MQAIMLEGYRKIGIHERPDPLPDGHRVIVKISKCGICGSEYHAWYDMGEQMKGRSIGHEFAGYVADPGSRNDLKAGDKVAVCPTVGCGSCEECRSGRGNLCVNDSIGDGAFSQCKACEPEKVIKLPDDADLVEAAMLEPLATSVRAVRLANVFNGASVLVIGYGIIGSTCVSLAKNAGALQIAVAQTPISRGRLLERSECVEIYDAAREDILDALRTATNHRGFDIVFECAGSGTALNLAVNAVKKGGTVMLVGANPAAGAIITRDIVIREIRILSSYAYTMDDFVTGLRLVQAGRINIRQYATRFVTLQQVPQTFDDLVAKKIDDVKVIVDIDGSHLQPL